MNINQELKLLYKEDQKDRSGVDIKRLDKFDWKWLKERDEKRLQRVNQIYKQGLITKSQDMYHAGMIYQHGGSSDRYKIAVALSEKGMKLGNKDCKWLYSRAVDRYRLSIGKTQIWGTNWDKNPSGKWVLAEPFDKKAKTDAERKAMGIDIEGKSKELNK